MKLCKDCDFWELKISGGDIASSGNCRRFPPTQRNLTELGYPEPDSWPARTWEFDGCGEWRPK